MTNIQAWKRSSRCTQTNNCVEVANTLGAVRDSKNPNGPALTGNIPALLTAARSGTLDH